MLNIKTETAHTDAVVYRAVKFTRDLNDLRASTYNTHDHQI